MSKENPSLLEVAVSRVGLRKAVTALTFAIKWGLWQESNDPTRVNGRAPDFAVWALMGDSTARRQLRVFRDVFPEFAGPDAMWDWAKAEIDRKASVRVQMVQLGALRWAAVA